MCKSLETFIANIQEDVNNIMEKEQEPTPFKPADFETGCLQFRKVFADLIKSSTGVTATLGHDFYITTYLAAQSPHWQPYRMSNMEPAEFGIPIGKLLAKR
jgi:hypothetical protein